MSMESDRFSGPLFLVGMPRSGTKLLREILNRSQVVRIPRVETEFLPYLASTFASFGDVSNLDNFERFFKHMRQFPFFFHLDEQGAVSGKAWYGMVRDYSPQGVFEGLIRLVTGIGWEANRIWGDKSPSYVHHLPLLKEFYPGARFIHIVRDVRDYSLSINRAWGKNMVRASFKWAQGVRDVKQFELGNPGCLLQVHYESLLSSPEKELEKITEFLGVSFSADMLAVGSDTENIGDAKGRPGIITENTGKYRSALTTRNLRRIEEAAFDSMINYGYMPEIATSTEKPGKASMLWLQFMDAVNLVLVDRREMGTWRAIKFHVAYKRATRMKPQSN